MATLKAHPDGSATITVTELERSILHHFWGQADVSAMIANNLLKNPMWVSGARAAWQRAQLENAMRGRHGGH